MDPITTGSIIAAGASLLGNGANAYATAKMNKRTIRYNERMYNTQRAAQLADRDFENAYNSPAQQMQRLREAGLNPHLIYNQGGQATQASASTSPIKPGEYPQNVPDIGAAITGPVSAYLETKQYGAQQKLLDAQTLKALTEVDTKNFDLSQKQRLADTQASIMDSIAKGKAQDNIINWERNEREAIKQSSDLAEAAIRMGKMATETAAVKQGMGKTTQEISNLKASERKIEEEIRQLKKDGKIKDFEIALNKAGFTKSDPVWARAGKTLYDAIFGKITGKSTEEIGTEAAKSMEGIGDAAANIIMNFIAQIIGAK